MPEQGGTSVVRELIFFDLHLGQGTEDFNAAFKEVQAEMASIGVVLGRKWGYLTGTVRTVVYEREFESLAAYEEDDALFHNSKDFMRLWRAMESTLRGMRVEVWQN